MNWLKRNLFFAIGMAVALLLLGASGYYIWSQWSRNSAKFDELNGIYSSLRNIKPGTDKQENIDEARQQATQVREWIAGTKKYFKPIERIPSGQLTDSAFSTALHSNITVLQQEAFAANVILPPAYNFSFQAQSDKVRFAPGSLDKLAVQLGEVKTITEILYRSHINALEGIQRLRVSEDDTQGQATDYIDDPSLAPQPDGSAPPPQTTSDLATLTPYQVTFRGFSSEIAQVLSSLGSSSNCFIVKTINVQPANAGIGMGTGMDMGMPPPPVISTRGPQTLLSEQMLRVTMMIEVVKLVPGR